MVYNLMTTPDISIVIPVYNLQRYLPESLQSLTNRQFLPNESYRWEIIIVDDGSTDDSSLVVGQVIESYPESIRLIRTPNRGVSSARNIGLDAARGKYILFFDGDDLLKSYSLPRLIDAAIQSKCDMLHFGYTMVDTMGYDALVANGIPKGASGNIALKFSEVRQFLVETNAMTGPPVQWNIWQNLFRRDFIIEHNIRFRENLSIGEDGIFIWEIMLSSPRLFTSIEELYIYHIRPGSLIHNSNPAFLRRAIYNRMQYLESLYNIRNELLKMRYDKTIIKGLDIEIRNVFYRALTDMLISGDNLHTMLQNMIHYQRHGGDIRIGRPRFYHQNKSTASCAIKLRRWLVAYPVGLVLSAFKH